MLRDYQNTAWQGAFDAFRAGFRAPVITLPTGTGKGTLEAAFAVFLADRGKRVVLTAPREEIARDLLDRVRKAGGDPGAVAPWAQFEPEKMIQVAMAPTLANRFHLLPVPDVLMLDETHHAPAAGYQRFIDAWPSAVRIGFTATLWRLDGQGFEGIFDTIIPSPDPDWFVAQGYLTDLDYHAPFVPDLKGVKSGNGDFDQDALEEALERSRVFGNAVRAFTSKVRKGGTAIAFCCSKRHAEIAAKAFNDAGIRAEVLLGEDQGEERKSKLARLARGETQVLCSVDVVSEGFDLPSIDAVILLRPTKSLSLFLQQVGRVLRTVFGVGFDLGTAEGRLAAIAAGPKPRAVCLDCAGNYWRHGHPLNPRTWSLEGDDPEARKHTHTEEGEDISSKRCEACLQVFRTPAVACPYCGEQCGQDARVPAAVAAEMRLVERQKEEEAKKEERRARAGARSYKALFEKARRQRNVKNPRHYTKNILLGRARKALAQDDFEEAAAIGADLAYHGFKEVDELREEFKAAWAAWKERQAAA